MRICAFSALVTFDLAACGGAASRYLRGTRARCVVQACHQQYFLGMLSAAKLPRPEPAAHALLTVALRDGEAEAFFAPGRRLTIWADAIVGTTICGSGLVGYGVTESQLPVPQIAGHDEAQRPSARPALPAPEAVHRPASRSHAAPRPRPGPDASLAGRSL